ncbi:hypothetical protein ElyMa_004569300 [Elysia marginata]|uniref:Uncharacterized protein n=1 Tax=Elysia marginata TaxID=1093978 RepID=A0AAV4HRZ7_9GAST|nr:hypothetical protein ElyMa_004569300 [Elysia marginata]
MQACHWTLSPCQLRHAMRPDIVPVTSRSAVMTPPFVDVSLFAAEYFASRRLNSHLTANRQTDQRRLKPAQLDRSSWVDSQDILGIWSCLVTLW